MYLKKLKLQNKIIKISSIFITVCTVIYLTVPSSLYKAEGSGTYNIRAVDTYYYGVLSYNLENTPPNYIKVSTGSSPLVSATTPNYYYHYKFAFNNYGCYNGRLQLTFDRGSIGVVDSILVEGAVLYSSSNDTSGFYITIEFNGDKYATMDIYIRTATNSLSYSDPVGIGTWTEHGNSVAENVENSYNQLVNINTAISTINTYTNQINNKLALTNNHLFDISSNTTTLVTNTNNINNKLDTLHSDNQSIISAINNISIEPSQTDITNINNFNNQLDIVNDIELNLLDNLDDTVNNRTADQWLEIFKDDNEIVRYKTILSGVTMPFYTSTILKWIFIFLLIGVVLG